MAECVNHESKRSLGQGFGYTLFQRIVFTYMLGDPVPQKKGSPEPFSTQKMLMWCVQMLRMKIMCLKKAKFERARSLPLKTIQNERQISIISSCGDICLSTTKTSNLSRNILLKKRTTFHRIWHQLRLVSTRNLESIYWTKHKLPKSRSQKSESGIHSKVLSFF